MTDLNTVIDANPANLYLLEGESINSSGQIIGLAVDSDGNLHGYLATPKWGDWDSEEMLAPVRLPESVRDQVRRQLGFGRFVPHPSVP